MLKNVSRKVHREIDPSNKKDIANQKIGVYKNFDWNVKKSQTSAIYSFSKEDPLK